MYCMARNDAGGSLRIFEAPPVPAILLTVSDIGMLFGVQVSRYIYIYIYNIYIS